MRLKKLKNHKQNNRLKNLTLKCTLNVTLKLLNLI